MTGQRNFRTLIEGRWDRGRFLCVGLDPDLGRIPASVMDRARASANSGRSPEARAVLGFCRDIVEATADAVCAFKPNAAFFEALGPDGAWALEQLFRLIREVAPDVPTIYDAKRGDIGSTNTGYVESAFERLGADAITVHPYLGREAVQPFLDRADKGIFVLCRTSNPGGGEFQDLPVGSEPLYRVVARRVATGWNANGNCALVVGATFPAQLAEVRACVGEMPILIPGIGAQGGDLRASIEAGIDGRGRGIIVSASRLILHASSGVDYAQAARLEAGRLSDAIKEVRASSGAVA